MPSNRACKQPGKPPQQSDADFDILGWWKNNSSKYRVLSLVARDVLAMPVSTVASKLAFSTGGHILDPFRSSLHPATVEILVCTQNWLQSNHIICLRKALDDVEQIEETMEESSTCSSPAPTSDVVKIRIMVCTRVGGWEHFGLWRMWMNLEFNYDLILDECNLKY